MKKLRVNELNNYIRIAAEALEHSTLVATPLHHPLPGRPRKKLNEYFRIDKPKTKDARLNYVKWLVRFCANQYMLDMPRIMVKFSKLKQNKAGHIFNKQGIWYVEINEKYKWNDLHLTAIIAHEMAHLILELKKIRLEPTIRNEELTDTVSVLAGFGRAAIVCSLTQKVNPIGILFGIVSVESSKLGYLSREEISYLAGKKKLMSQKTPIKRPQVLTLSEGRNVDCYSCAMTLRVPERTGTLIIACPICHTRQLINIRSDSGLNHL